LFRYVAGETLTIADFAVLKHVLQYLNIRLFRYVAGDTLTIADFAVLASVTQLEGMEYRITSYT
jgi:glutathione S-transferase